MSCVGGDNEPPDHDVADSVTLGDDDRPVVTSPFASVIHTTVYPSLLHIQAE